MADGGSGAKRPDTIKSEVVVVTPKMAKSWLETRHEGQRAVAEKRVQSIASDIEAGNWRLTHQGIAFDAQGHLIDGQHRLSAIVLADKAVPLLVFKNASASMADPIDRGAPRSVAFVSGVPTRTVAAIAVLYRFERGILSYNVPVTVAQTIETMGHHQAHLDAIRAIRATGMQAGLIAACAWVMPIDPSATIDFLRKVVTGELIRRGDPSYALRNWDQRRAGHGQHAIVFAMASLNCLRHHIHGLTLKSVYTGEMGYRGSVSKRRAMRIPNTPGTDLVTGVSWPVNKSE